MAPPSSTPSFTLVRGVHDDVAGVCRPPGTKDPKTMAVTPAVKASVAKEILIVASGPKQVTSFSTPSVMRSFCLAPDPTLNMSLNPDITDPKQVADMARQKISCDPLQRKAGQAALAYAIKHHPKEVADSLKTIEKTLPAEEVAAIKNGVISVLKEMKGESDTPATKAALLIFAGEVKDPILKREALIAYHDAVSPRGSTAASTGVDSSPPRLIVATDTSPSASQPVPDPTISDDRVVTPATEEGFGTTGGGIPQTVASPTTLPIPSSEEEIAAILPPGAERDRPVDGWWPGFRETPQSAPLEPAEVTGEPYLPGTEPTFDGLAAEGPMQALAAKFPEGAASVESLALPAGYSPQHSTSGNTVSVSPPEKAASDRPSDRFREKKPFPSAESETGETEPEEKSPAGTTEKGATIPDRPVQDGATLTIPVGTTPFAGFPVLMATRRDQPVFSGSRKRGSPSEDRGHRDRREEEENRDDREKGADA